MMKKFKYVIINNTFPILFGEAHKHSEFANCSVGASLGRATSAGFCSISVEDGKMSVSTFGESVSLFLRSNKEDAEIISRMLQPDE